MARSRKKTPIFATCFGETEKFEKRKANRALRRAVHIELDKVQDVETAEECQLAELREVSDVWSWNKDGKRYWNPSLASPHYEKDHETQIRMLRK